MWTKNQDEMNFEIVCLKTDILVHVMGYLNKIACYCSALMLCFNEKGFI